MAMRAISLSWSRPRKARAWSRRDCTPMDRRLTPAAFSPSSRCQQRRRSAPQIETVGLAMLRHARAVDFEILPDRVEQRGIVPILGRIHIEVAVRADLRTVRPMDVDAKSIFRTERSGRLSHESNAAFSLATAFARWLMACFRCGSISPNVMDSPSATKTGS